MTTAHITGSFTKIIEGFNHKLLMDIFSPVHIYLMTCIPMLSTGVTVRQSHKGMPVDFDNETLISKEHDIHAKVRGILIAVIWKDK
jgi:hypothetical protein